MTFLTLQIVGGSLIWRRQILIWIQVRFRLEGVNFGYSKSGEEFLDLEKNTGLDETDKKIPTWGQLGNFLSNWESFITSVLVPWHPSLPHHQYQHTEVLVNACHPMLTKPSFLVSGITAIGLLTGTHLIGQQEVPLIPQSAIMLISESQARCFGINSDSKSHRFGDMALLFWKWYQHS